MTVQTIASDLLQRHFKTLVDDNAQWQTLIADDLVWELPYAPALGHPARLTGRKEAMRHITWFLGAVENFRFFDLKVHVFADPDAGGKIAFLREYFDPVRASKAMGAPILGLESCGGEAVQSELPARNRFDRET